MGMIHLETLTIRCNPTPIHDALELYFTGEAMSAFAGVTRDIWE